jgi:uncharacterized protein (DUF1015 family)
MQDRYYDLSAYNLVRIIKGRQHPTDTPEGNVYTRAARYLGEWIDQGALVTDPSPAIYPYYQEYAAPGQYGVAKQRRGFIALARLEDYSARVVHRHEETLSGPKADRLELLKTTRAHCEQLFMLYSDPSGEIEKAIEGATLSGTPQAATDEYGCKHSLWRLDDLPTVNRIRRAMHDKKLVIADGHHRYETALAYRNFSRALGRSDERAESVMMTFIRKESEGLTILPTHRLVHSLAGFDWNGFVAGAQRFFVSETVELSAAEGDWTRLFCERLSLSGREAPSIGVYACPERLVLMRLRNDIDLGRALPDLPEGLRRLDVVILHRLLLEQTLGIDRQAVREEKNLHYVRDSGDAVGLVENGKAQIAFLLNATLIDRVWDNALSGNPLPQKSTDFYPKLLSGLTLYWLDGPGEL